MSSGRKFRRREWRNSQPGEALPPSWARVEEREQVAYMACLDFIAGKMPKRGFMLITCPRAESGADVPIEAIGYGSNLSERKDAVEIFHALEDYWQRQGLVASVVTARSSRAASPAPAPAGGFRRRVQDLWVSFEGSVLPEDCSDVQRSETRRAFYAGAFALLGAIGEATSGSDTVTAEDERIMLDLEVERQEYLANLTTGRA